MTSRMKYTLLALALTLTGCTGNAVAAPETAPELVKVIAEDGTTTLNYTDGADTASGGVVVLNDGTVADAWGTVPDRAEADIQEVTDSLSEGWDAAPEEDEPGWDCRTMGNRLCG